MELTMTYTEILTKYYDWQWEADFRTAYGDFKNALRAFKKMKQYQDMLWGFKGVNVERGEV